MCARLQLFSEQPYSVLQWQNLAVEIEEDVSGRPLVTEQKE